MRGDINAVELYQDRKFLERVGFGIYDIAVGSTGGVGFEDVHRYSYLEAEEADPKLYRRKVFELIGEYYPNDLAHILWDEFGKYQAQIAEQTGMQLSLKDCAMEWLAQHGNALFTEWALQQPEIPHRIRNQKEIDLRGTAGTLWVMLPDWRELIENGFSCWAIALATLINNLSWLKYRLSGQQKFVRKVARLSKLPLRDVAELKQTIAEIERFQQQEIAANYTFRAATIEYYRRLVLAKELEEKNAHLTFGGTDLLNNCLMA